MEGTEWILDEITSMEININKWDPLRGSSYIKLPKELSAKKAIINPKNENDINVFCGQY